MAGQLLNLPITAGVQLAGVAVSQRVDLGGYRNDSSGLAGAGVGLGDYQKRRGFQ